MEALADCWGFLLKYTAQLGLSLITLRYETFRILGKLRMTDATESFSFENLELIVL